MRHWSKGDWTNVNFKDIFFEVIYVQYGDHKIAKLKGYWWNLGWTGNPMRHTLDKYSPDRPVMITIKAEHFKDWKHLESRIRTVPEVA